MFAWPLWSTFINGGPAMWGVGAFAFLFVLFVSSSLALFSVLRIHARIGQVTAAATRPATGV